MTAPTCTSLSTALAHHQAGNIGQAERVYRDILRIDPEHADALHLLGVCAHQQNRHSQAIDYMSRAIALSAPAAVLHNNLGTAHRALGESETALACFREAIRITPEFAGAHLNAGLVLKSQGDVAAASAAFETVLWLDSEFVDAHVQLGRLHAELANVPQAVEAFERAVHLDGNCIEAHAALAQLHFEQSRYESAMSCWRNVLLLEPQHAAAHYELGRCFEAAGDLEAASSCYREARSLSTNNATVTTTARHTTTELHGLIERVEESLRMNPESAVQRFEYGEALEKLGRFEQAALAYQSVLAVDPAYAVAACRLGDLCRLADARDEAARCYQTAAGHNATSVTPLTKLAALLHDERRFDEAIEHYTRAINLTPDVAELRFELGNVFKDADRYDEAIGCYRRALDVSPEHDGARLNLGIVLRNKGRLSESIECFDSLLKNADDAHPARLQRGLLWLAGGDFARGWEAYESRWKCEIRPRPLSIPAWNGSPLGEQTILIYGEQGLGDEIMFSSCIPEIARQAAGCVVECDPRLVPLLTRSMPEATVLGRPYEHRPEWTSSQREIDVACAMGSLPRFTRASIDAFPKTPRHLVADSNYVDQWRRELENLGTAPKIGISWRGGKQDDHKRQRSIALERFAPLLTIPGLQFIDLQHGESSGERTDFHKRTGIAVHHFDEADPLTDVDGFAALVSALDLVISVDNSTAHLAGALGVPVWLLLPSAANFRWMTDHTTTPWYSSMRLFRQSQPGHWAPLLDDVVRELKSTRLC